MDEHHPYNVSGYEEAWQVHPDTAVLELNDVQGESEAEDAERPF
jgi:hypothetical protein